MAAFSISRSDLPLQPAPIHPDWIHEGNPQARNQVLSRSRDGSAVTLLWECTGGVFTWRYDSDETIHVLEGQATLWDGSKARRIEAGDVVFFPAGARVTWHVEGYIRKVAFFREVLPTPMILPMRVWWRGTAVLRSLAEAVVRRAPRRLDLPRQPALPGLDTEEPTAALRA